MKEILYLICLIIFKKIDFFPNAFVACRILLIVPIIATSAERSFSKLKLLKSYLRTITSQERLNEWTILAIEKDLLDKLEYKILIDNFTSQKARKIKFNWLVICIIDDLQQGS